MLAAVIQSQKETFLSRFPNMEVVPRLPASPANTPVPSIQAQKNSGDAASLGDAAQFIDPTASPWTVSALKRFLDAAVSLVVLVIFAAPMLLIALCVRLTSPGPALFRQRRVGRNGKLFVIYKFRSMTVNAGAGIGLTKHGDHRITPLGRWLRKVKLDELPQFYNVVLGDMSLVGPRPKLPQYVVLRNTPYRPGITGAATLAFRREEEILSRIHPAEMENFYHRHIKPLKARIDARYMCRATFWSDLRIIAATFLACVASPRVPAVVRKASRQGVAFQSLPAIESASGDSLSSSN
jgi:lipopolysaccharide/colanic/teichoic acid biosynthesis glycosyltransferase